MIFLNKSSPLLKIGNSFILILFIAVISFSIFQFYSVETSLKNRQRLESVKNKYFPILERIDQNIVRLNHIKELHLQAVMTGESGLLNEAEKEWQQAIKTFQEMKLIAPASSTRIEDLRQQFRRYVKLGSGTSETIIDQLGVTTNISPLIAQMNIDLELLHREIQIFRQNSYKQFVSTLNKSNDSADQNLYFGIAIGLMNLIFMGILVFFIINNKKMMRVIEKHNISLEQQVIERTEELIDAKEIAEHANRAKSTFLANMSHEIRTPLNHVLGFAEIISEEDDVDEMHDCAIKIETAGKHLLGLINDILDLSKIESDGMDLRLSSFNLDELTANINDLFTATCQTKDIELTILNQLPNHTVVADMQRLQQIMINIVGNAVKFIEQGSIKFHIDKVDNLYLFEVIDTGPGMDQKTVDNIFKPFEQGYAGHDKGGTGLGMAITHRFIEMMQGQITIQSEQGAGSCFSITLPLKTANDNIETDDLDKSKKSHIQLKNIKALIVDDNELNRELLKFFLKKEGINAQMAINGKQCCDILEKVTEEDSPDIIFMDIRMPVMSGDDAFLYCKKRHPKIKYIAATSSVMKKDLDQYKNLGFDGYLPKPMSMSGVLKILKKVLE